MTMLVMAAALLAIGFVGWHRSPLDRGNAEPMARATVLQHWREGKVVVLVRHAERCDRSANPCLGPADGITHLGSSHSQTVGQAFQSMGMGNTDVLSSPLTRTAQTAQYMFGKQAASKAWLASCGDSLSAEVLSHKAARRNLVLVTHSGCISDFERQSGFDPSATADYTSSLWVSVAGDGKPVALGYMNVAEAVSVTQDAGRIRQWARP
jgi:phosphohistidine phosphatase SixA